jgi:pSer/pThr/pTyr-binding forkhead associated (FHA) protein
MAKLHMLADGKIASTFDLSDDYVRIGRTPESDLCIAHPSVSKFHGMLVRSGTDYEIHDFASANGVFVNGEHIMATLLAHGDQVRIGTVEFRYELTETPALPVKPVPPPAVTLKPAPKPVGDRPLGMRAKPPAPAPVPPAPPAAAPAPVPPPPAPPAQPVAPAPPAPAPVEPEKSKIRLKPVEAAPVPFTHKPDEQPEPAEAPVEPAAPPAKTGLLGRFFKKPTEAPPKSEAPAPPQPEEKPAPPRLGLAKPKPAEKPAAPPAEKKDEPAAPTGPKKFGLRRE